jgi:hypothetical protein
LGRNDLRDLAGRSFGGVDPQAPRAGPQAVEPGPLVLAQASGLDLDPFDGLVERLMTLEVGDELLVADGLSGLRAEASGGPKR